ncbi:MAG: hypothetical protein EBX44_16285 [Betaproteobacteria bacterium]|nr:hypothetical protein [Betaproteobacteria bacterium]
MRTVLPVSPGEMLEEEFLKPLGLTKYRLAKDIGVPAHDGWWLRGQVAYDTAVAKAALRKQLATIQRCPLLVA